MHPLVLIFLIGCGSGLARYRGYEARNIVEREEPLNEDNGDLVECPVCEDSGHWMPSNEECPIVMGNKRFKRCELGTYVNKVCGGRMDCYRGPGEQCTVKRDYDIYGQKCAPGYYCNKPLGICQGLDYKVNTKIQYLLNPTPYSLRQRGHVQNENGYIRSD